MNRSVLIVVVVTALAIYLTAVLVFPDEVLPSISQHFTSAAGSKLPLACFLHGGAFKTMQCR